MKKEKRLEELVFNREPDLYATSTVLLQRC